MASLHTRMAAWQTPQEVIVPTYLPPFLRDPDQRESRLRVGRTERH
jgi:hypothetical protein